jgi:hypothetical protein
MRKTVQRRNNLAHGFGSFSPWPADSPACRPMPKQKCHRRRMLRRKAVYLMATRKQKGIIGRGQCQDTPLKGLPQKPTFSNSALVPPLPNNLFKFQTHQWITSLIRSESSWSNGLWNCSCTHRSEFTNLNVSQSNQDDNQD